MREYLYSITTNRNVNLNPLDSSRNRFVSQLGLLEYDEAMAIEEDVRKHGNKEAAEHLVSMVSDILSLEQNQNIPLKLSIPGNKNGWNTTLEIELGSIDNTFPIESTSQFPIKLDLITDGRIEKAVRIDVLNIPGVTLVNDVYILNIFSSKDTYSKIAFRQVNRRGITNFQPMLSDNSHTIADRNYMDAMCLLYATYKQLSQEEL